MSDSGYTNETEWEKRLRTLDEDLATRVIAGALERAYRDGAKWARKAPNTSSPSC